MKKYIILKVLLYLPFLISAQEDLVRYQTPSMEINGLVYNLKTGKKLSDKELSNIVKTYPNLVLIPQINKYGLIEKYLFDEENPRGSYNYKDDYPEIKPGDFFPKFDMKTIEGKRLTNEKFEADYLIFRCEILSDDKFLNMNKLHRFDKIVEATQATVRAVVIFQDSKQAILKNVDLSKFKVEFTSGGKYFEHRFGVSSFPRTIIIDKENKVVGYFNDDDYRNIDKLLKN